MFYKSYQQEGKPGAQRRGCPCKTHCPHHDTRVYLFIDIFIKFSSFYFYFIIIILLFLLLCKLTALHLYHTVVLLGCPWKTYHAHHVMNAFFPSKS